MKKLLGVLVLAAGIISGVLFFVAGARLSSSAADLTEIRSVGGNSVAEAYYQEMGRHGLAYSMISYAAGLGIIAISLGLGGLLLTSEDNRAHALYSQQPGQQIPYTQTQPPYNPQP